MPRLEAIAAGLHSHRPAGSKRAVLSPDTREVDMRPSIVVLAVLIWSALALAADWPAWRGPDGQGHCSEKNLPLRWSKSDNVKWKIPLELPGNSTPVIWGDRIFLTQANKDGILRGLLCLARDGGKLLWKQE